MSEISYIPWQSLSDEAFEKEIGLYIKKVRQQQNKTQESIAKAANISRSTLSLLERGETGSLKTLIQILRVLDKLKVLEVFKYEKPTSPLALAKAQHKTKERVRPSKKTKNISTQKKSNW
ncbi:MAG: transcriptional regulator with XRE-family HTH domain [Saprospiraceae bacterium]|jgi:transcriptional regulator with XRE-family HTH domain